ncbi:MAG: helix-turn-helix domain-containing protein [Clostridia bacterium]|nr:helix-turn-helix domain-containing protein [Clostridia bacterium]
MEIRKFTLREQLFSVEPYLQAAALARLDSEWSLEQISSPFTRLYYILSGEAWVEWGGKRISLEAGRVYLIPAGLTFSAGCRSAAEKLFFHISLLKRDGYDLAMELHTVASLPFEQARAERLCRLAEQENHFNALMLKTMLMEDLLRFFEVNGIGLRREDVCSEAVRQTMDYIRKHLSVQLSVRALAERAYLSERTLNYAFRRELGKTVGQYIDEMVLFEAQRRLLLTDRPIAEISEQLGFCDQFYFSRRFKERCGKSPSAYRGQRG